MELLGCPHKNLVNMVDFSVHQVLVFNFSGSASSNDRCALVVVNHPKGEPLLDYMAANWMDMTDNDFRLILMQVVRALASLHRCACDNTPIYILLNSSFCIYIFQNTN
jgi:hypothetical protein